MKIIIIIDFFRTLFLYLSYGSGTSNLRRTIFFISDLLCTKYEATKISFDARSASCKKKRHL